MGTFTSTLMTTQEDIVASIEKAGEKVSCEMNEKQRLLVAHTQLHVLSNKYAAVLSTGNVFCVICTENAGAMSDGRIQKSPLTIFVKLQPLGIVYDDEDHEASGLACFNQLCEVTLAWNYSGIFSARGVNTTY